MAGADLTKNDTPRADAEIDVLQMTTMEALKDLNESVKALRTALVESKESWIHRNSRSAPSLEGRSSSSKSLAKECAGTSCEEDDQTDTSFEDDEDLYNRKEVRLNGLEVYAVVSAVTAGTLVAVFDSYNPEDVSKLWSDGNYLDIAISVIFLVNGTVGIVSGLHCIVVFSLITMYGRTALGMNREDALESFFAETGLQRYLGHQSFVYSLYALMMELIIVITTKFSQHSVIHVIALAVCSRLMYFVYADTQHIMEKAGVIYAPPPSLKEEGRGTSSSHSKASSSQEDEPKNSGDCRRAAMKIAKTRNSVRAMSVMNMAATDLMPQAGGRESGWDRVKRNAVLATIIPVDSANDDEDDIAS